MVRGSWELGVPGLVSRACPRVHSGYAQEPADKGGVRAWTDVHYSLLCVALDRPWTATTPRFLGVVWGGIDHY